MLSKPNRPLMAAVIAVLLLGSAATFKLAHSSATGGSGNENAVESFVDKMNDEGQHSFSFNYAWRSDTVKPSGQIVQIALADFTQLESRGTVGITQDCADKSYAEIDQALLAQVDRQDLERGIVRLNKDVNVSEDMPPIRIHTRQPQTAATNRGIAEMSLACMGDTAELGNYGTGDLRVHNKQPFSDLRIGNFGTGLIQAGDARSSVIRNTGTGNIVLANVENASVSLYGTGDVSFANAPHISSTVRGTGSIRTMVQSSK